MSFEEKVISMLIFRELTGLLGFVNEVTFHNKQGSKFFVEVKFLRQNDCGFEFSEPAEWTLKVSGKVSVNFTMDKLITKILQQYDKTVKSF